MAVRRETKARNRRAKKKVFSVRNVIVTSCPNNRTSFQYRVYYAACVCNVNVPLLSMGEPLGPEGRREGRAASARPWIATGGGTWCSPGLLSLGRTGPAGRGQRAGAAGRERTSISGHNPLPSYSNDSTKELSFQNLGDRTMRSTRAQTPVSGCAGADPGGRTDGQKDGQTASPDARRPAPRLPPAPTRRARAGSARRPPKRGRPCPPHTQPQAAGSRHLPSALTPRSSSERKSGPSSEPSCLGARRRRRGRGARKGTAGGREGERRQSAQVSECPAAPPALPRPGPAPRPPRTHHHGCSRRSAPAGAAAGRGCGARGGAGRGGGGERRLSRGSGR